jgi:hypothetical protein
MGETKKRGERCIAYLNACKSINKRWNGQQGLGLAELLVASGLIAILLAALTKGIENFSKSGRKIETSTNLNAIKAQITSAVDCPKTMAGRAPGNACPSPEYIDLKSAIGGVVISRSGQRIGEWTVLAQCDSTGIAVRAAKLINGPANFSNTEPGNFRADEMDQNLRYSFTGHPKAALFSPALGSPAASLCGAWFGGARGSEIKMCGADELMKGINVTTGEPVCDKVPASGGGGTLGYFACPTGQVMSGINGNQPICRAEGGVTASCPIGSVLSGIVENAPVCKQIGAGDLITSTQVVVASNVSCNSAYLPENDPSSWSIATCPADYKLTGGGATTDGIAPTSIGPFAPKKSQPYGADLNSWGVYMSNKVTSQMMSGGMVAVCYKAFAVCSK